jgi:II/X family phage/plasmid replication protein
MAIDTVKIRSPYITEELASKIEGECVRKQGLDLKTGEILYEITTGSLEGSYDHRISIIVRRERWTSSDHWATKPMKKTRSTPVKIECEPYLELEGSVHKALMGHNIYGGTTQFRVACRFLVNLVEELTGGEKLPDSDMWEVHRVDHAEIYLLDSFETISEWFRGTNTANYPRRSVTRFGLTGIYAQGSTSVLKFYHKGPEFIKHDRKRLSKILPSEKMFELQELANSLIRVELETKARKLKYDFGHLPLVREVTEEYLDRLLDAEVKRFLKEGVTTMQLVKNATDVEKRLYSSYKPNLAGILLGTWFKLSTLGEDYVKKSLPKKTFYRHRNQLKEVGISWTGTDVVLEKKPSILDDFVPLKSDPRRLVIECPEVEAKLKPFMDIHREKQLIRAV